MGDVQQYSEEQLLKYIHASNAFHWITDNKLQLGAGPWTLKNHEYQLGWLECDAPEQCFIKGAQIGASEINVLKTLHGHVHGRFNQGSLYLFPTRDDVGDFAQTRFDPLINQNPFIGAYVDSTDRKNVKKIGQGHLYLRGARTTRKIEGTKKSSTALKSISVDRVVFDEFDEMEPAMIELAKFRISHSDLGLEKYGQGGELIYLGTPTIPDYGIDAMYHKSDQRVWKIERPACGKETSLDLDFPASIRRRLDGSAYRACIHCYTEIHPSKGRWEAQVPSMSDTLVGWWISQLNSVYVNPTRILDAYENPPGGDLSEVMNSMLGRAYIPAENRLTKQDVYACCGNDPMLTKHEGPTCMGVDVGSLLHVVIAQRTTRKTLKILHIGRYQSFNDLHDLARDFNVKSAVIDLFPEKRKVVEFQKAENFSVFGCNYVETKTGSIAWDEKDHIIKGNRTEICDMTHDQVMEPGGLILPRRNTEVDEFVVEMCNIAKLLDEDTSTGAKTFRYKKLNANDHYRHAFNYCLLASERIGTVSDSKLIGRFFKNRRRRTWMSV
jgi:hypothetical protein